MALTNLTPDSDIDHLSPEPGVLAVLTQMLLCAVRGQVGDVLVYQYVTLFAYITIFAYLTEEKRDRKKEARLVLFARANRFTRACEACWWAP